MSPSGQSDFLTFDIRGALWRYPFPILAAALLMLWSLVDRTRFPTWLTTELKGAGWSIQWDIPLMLDVAFLAATAAGFAAYWQSRQISWALQGAAFLCGLAAAALFTNDGGFRLLLALICAVSLGAGVAAGRGSSGFWLANVRLGTVLTAGVCAAGLATLGVEIVFAAKETLLWVEMWRLKRDILQIVWTFSLQVLSLTLARFDQDETLGGRGILFRILAIVTDALLIPLVLVFGALIHVYAARIAWAAELPKDQIDWIVPLYLAAGYGIYLLAEGREIYLPRLRTLFQRWFFASTLIPLVLLALAVAVRIRAHGITEDQYNLALVVLGGSLVAGLAALRRPLDIRLLPAVAGALALLAAVSPLSARNVTIRNQTERARTILALVPAERWATVQDGGLTEQQKQDLLGAVAHLQELVQSDLSSLAPVWPPHVPLEWAALKERLGPGEQYQKTLTLLQGVVRLPNITLLDTFGVQGETTTTLAAGETKYEIHVHDHWLEVTGDGQTTRFDLSIYLTATDSVGLNPVLGSIEGRRGELIIRRVDRTSAAGQPSLKSLRAQAVLY
jgi:hypothetical protein